MKKPHALIMGSLFLTGVFTTSCAQVGRPFPEEYVRAIKINETPKEEIRRIFGPPLRMGLEDGKYTWTYGNYKYSISGEKEMSDLVIRFTDDGVVSSYSYSTTNKDLAW